MPTISGIEVSRKSCARGYHVSKKEGFQSVTMFSEVGSIVNIPYQLNPGEGKGMPFLCSLGVVAFPQGQGLRPNPLDMTPARYGKYMPHVSK